MLTIEPSTGTYGDGFAYTVSGLEPDAAYVLFIHQPNGFWVEMNAWGDETGAGLLWEDDYTFQKVPLTEVWFSTPGEPDSHATQIGPSVSKPNISLSAMSSSSSVDFTR